MKMVDTTRLRGSIFCQSPSSISGLSLPSYRSAFGYYVFLHMKIEIYYGAPNQQYLNFLRLRKFSQLNKYVCVATQTIITKKEKKIDQIEFILLRSYMCSSNFRHSKNYYICSFF